MAGFVAITVGKSNNRIATLVEANFIWKLFGWKGEKPYPIGTFLQKAARCHITRKIQELTFCEKAIYSPLEYS